MRRLIIVCTIATMLCSCYTSRILVGDTKPKEPMIEVAKSHDAHFIGGLVKTAKNVAEEHIGDAENYMIRSQYGFGDIVLSAITAGIYTPTTSKYYVPIRYIDSFTPKEPKVKPEKNNGFMLMTDLNGHIAKGGFMAGISAGYKFLDHYFAGVGLGAGVIRRSISPKNDNFDDTEYSKILGSSVDVFLRMRYLLYNSKNTPFANLDLGLNLADSNDYDLGMYNEKTRSVVITPSVGYQLRIAKNVSMDASIGYRIDTGFKSITSYSSELSRFSSSSLLLQLGFNFML